jgi:putative transposase
MLKHITYPEHITYMRKPRILSKDATYHVVARANRKEMILKTPEIKTLFLEVVAKARKRYAFTLDNFCIMGNHFHFIIRPRNGACLSKIMQWILSVFAMAYNKLHHICGHVWGERFYSKIIKDFKEYVATFSYIDENPVRSGLVTVRTDWKFGGLNYRRLGRKEIIEPLPSLLSWLFPEHSFPLVALTGKQKQR